MGGGAGCSIRCLLPVPIPPWTLCLPMASEQNSHLLATGAWGTARLPFQRQGEKNSGTWIINTNDHLSNRSLCNGFTPPATLSASLHLSCLRRQMCRVVIIATAPTPPPFRLPGRERSYKGTKLTASRTPTKFLSPVFKR